MIYSYDDGVWDVVKESLIQDDRIWEAYQKGDFGSYYYLEFRDEANAAMKRGGKDAVIAVTKREFKIK